MCVCVCVCVCVYVCVCVCVFNLQEHLGAPDAANMLFVENLFISHLLLFVHSSVHSNRPVLSKRFYSTQL